MNENYWIAGHEALPVTGAIVSIKGIEGELFVTKRRKDDEIIHESFRCFFEPIDGYFINAYYVQWSPTGRMHADYTDNKR